MSPSVPVRLLLSQSDERLVGYARAGHERAFEALVQRYRRQLLAYCRRLLLSEQRAEDALQQALLQAWVALRNGNEVTEPRAWLYRIVHNAAVNTLRSSRYDYCQLSESLSGADAPQADLDRRIAVREALAGLAALPEMQREALLRTAVGGRTHQQAASDLGVSEPALRGLVYRARASLRAATSAIVPPPLIGWALEAGTRGTPALEQVAGLGAGGSSAGLAGLLIKGSAVAVTAGALAGGIVANHAHHAGTHANRRSAKAADRVEAKQLTAAVAARPAAFIDPETADANYGQSHKNGIVAPRAKEPQRIRAQHHRRHKRATAQLPVPAADAPPAPTPASAPVPNWQPLPAGHPRRVDGSFQPASGGSPAAHDGPSDGPQHDGDGEQRSASHEPGHRDDGSAEQNGNGSSAETSQMSQRSQTSQAGQSGGEASASDEMNRDSRDGKDSSTDEHSGRWQRRDGSSTRTSSYRDDTATAEGSQQQGR